MKTDTNTILNNSSLNKNYDLILQNMGLIKKCVSEIKHSTYEYEDLVQEAVAILLEKINNFDPEKGSLSTFIWMNVKNALINSTQKMPDRLYKISTRIKKAKHYLSEKGEPVTAENLSTVLGMSVKAVKKYEAQLESFNYVEIDSPLSNEDGTDTFISLLSDERYSLPDELVINKSLRYELLKEVNSLPEDQRQIIILHYNLNNSEEGCLSFRKIAERLNIKHQTVSYIESKALKTLKNQLRSA